MNEIVVLDCSRTSYKKFHSCIAELSLCLLRSAIPMKLLVIVLFVIGITLVLNGYYRNTMQCPGERIVYKFLPRTLSEDNRNEVKVSDIFQPMFRDADPGVYGM